MKQQLLTRMANRNVTSLLFVFFKTRLEIHSDAKDIFFYIHNAFKFHIFLHIFSNAYGKFKNICRTVYKMVEKKINSNIDTKFHFANS